MRSSGSTGSLPLSNPETHELVELQLGDPPGIVANEHQLGPVLPMDEGPLIGGGGHHPASTVEQATVLDDESRGRVGSIEFRSKLISADNCLKYFRIGRTAANLWRLEILTQNHGQQILANRSRDNLTP